GPPGTPAPGGRSPGAARRGHHGARGGDAGSAREPVVPGRPRLLRRRPHRRRSHGNLRPGAPAPEPPVEPAAAGRRGPLDRGLCRRGPADRDVRGAAEVSVARKPATPSLSREALELLARRFRALGDATRLALLQALFGGERTVHELCRLTRTSQANASKHL